ncbi:hypothetical protein BKH43_03745 [Helicobacter sp. 13S00401-1]|nr:hypothetical protein BKH43_03745 [Helicobacter sp. 13S00401-1]
MLCSASEVLKVKDVLEYANLKHNLDIKHIFTLPDIRLHYGDRLSSFYEEIRECMAQLTKFYGSMQESILISPFQTLLNYMPAPKHLDSFKINISDILSIDTLQLKLLDFGYESVDIIELEGEFSLRGDILDVYVPDLKMPLRILFYEDMIESIRYFDPTTQLSLKEEIPSIDIYPALFNANLDLSDELKYEEFELDYKSKCFWELENLGGLDLIKELKSIWTKEAFSEYKELIQVESEVKEIKSFYILGDAKTYSDFTPDFKNLQEFLARQKSFDILTPTLASLKANGLSETNYILKSLVVNIYSKDHCVISLLKEHKRTFKAKSTLSLDSIKPHDYVLHSDYGIGRFRGIKQIKLQGGIQDVLNIEYDKEEFLLLPIYNLNMVERYIAQDNIKLDRLGKMRLTAIKQKVKQDLMHMAGEIIDLQAKRALIQAPKFLLDTKEKKLAWEHFNAKRDFTLTLDQDTCLKECMEDLSSGKVMDRLLNGDVGFGKTEIALSLIKLALINGYSSILLVPTTLLSYQHFSSLKERLKKEGLGDELVFRLDSNTTKKEKDLILECIADKKPICLVGTQAIFNIELENLGLIIVDEEHKFGVKQKELLKQKGSHIHMLSMSATPIPRTLHMAFSNLKALSYLKTPPSYKATTKTFVKLKSDSLLKEVINRELRRGGQVFYIYNNIDKMPSVHSYLESLLPDVKILSLHSKVPPKELEAGMLDFMQKKYDILLSTSIVESGLHFPNANTIIIDNAKSFGLADLHQLRGRVGRGNAFSFCYLLSEDSLNEDATKRLLAMEKNSYLGSGAALANQDLEIRGGGNLLGKEQSGHIKQVGFGLYSSLLKECIESIKHSKSELSSKDSKIDIKLSINAYLSPTLIEQDRLRLELYQRLSHAKSIEDINNIEVEIEERFGRLDSNTLQFLDLMKIKLQARVQGISYIGNNASSIVLKSENDSYLVLAEGRDDESIMTALKTHFKV